MDFSFSDHQKLIRDTVRQFMETEVRPLVKDLEREEKFPLDLLKKIADLGCCGMLTPEEWGGPGLDTVSYVLMLEEVARVDAAMATSLSVTNSAVQAPLLAFGNDAQKKRRVGKVIDQPALGNILHPGAGIGKYRSEPKEREVTIVKDRHAPARLGGRPASWFIERAGNAANSQTWLLQGVARPV